MRAIPGTDLDVYPLCLGGNVFGWTADESASHAVLDKYIEQGGNFIDTADMYAGGRSESIIGDWLDERRNRDFIVLATKVGMAPRNHGLGAATIRAAVEGSLRRLQTDRIDLYYAHRDDPDTPLEETLAAFDGLVTRRPRPLHRGVELHSAAPRRGARRVRARRTREVRLPPAPLQPRRARLIRGRAAATSAPSGGSAACRTSAWPAAS